MKKIELNDLLQILGMVGLIASLIFVGLELRQNQQVARITAYQALTEQIHDINSLLVTDSQISDIVNRALQNQELDSQGESFSGCFFLRKYWYAEKLYPRKFYSSSSKSKILDLNLLIE